jgi:uncharacterized protein (DUF2147 family)
MKSVPLMTVLPFLLLLASPVAPAADTLASVNGPLGNWQRGDGNAEVRIEPCGGHLCAINTKIRDTSGGEQVGHRLVLKVKPTGAGTLAGDAFDPQREKTYAVDIVFNDKVMTTRGCILGILCKSVRWTRLP